VAVEHGGVSWSAGPALLLPLPVRANPTERSERRSTPDSPPRPVLPSAAAAPAAGGGTARRRGSGGCQGVPLEIPFLRARRPQTGYAQRGGAVRGEDSPARDTGFPVPRFKETS